MHSPVSYFRTRILLVFKPLPPLLNKIFNVILCADLQSEKGNVSVEWENTKQNALLIYITSYMCT